MNGEIVTSQISSTTIYFIFLDIRNKVCMMKKEELKLNDQIWIDYKANNEVSSGEALKEDKIVWVFKSVAFVYFPLHHPRVSM